jgi:succinate dehydrogenase hydrophobic anchor subunit
LSHKPLVAFYKSSIGKKITVALTGLILIVYVLGHLLGNLQIYLSPDRLNAYEEFLHALGPLLWLVRIILLAAFIIHIVATVQLIERTIELILARYIISATRTLDFPPPDPMQDSFLRPSLDFQSLAENECISAVGQLASNDQFSIPPIFRSKSACRDQLFTVM